MLKHTLIGIGTLLLVAFLTIPAGILLALTIPLFLVSIFPLVAVGFLYLGSRLSGFSWCEHDSYTLHSAAVQEPPLNQVIFQRHNFVIRRYELN